MSVVALREFSSAAEMMAHYKALHRRDRERRPPPVVAAPAPEPPPEPEPPPAEPILPIKTARGVRTSWIIWNVGRYFNIDKDDMISARRTARVVYARHICFYLMKRHTLLSFPEIGRRFGGRDHTTILHGYRKINAMHGTDPSVANDISMLETMILRDTTTTSDVWSG